MQLLLVLKEQKLTTVMVVQEALHLLQQEHLMQSLRQVVQVVKHKCLIQPLQVELDLVEPQMELAVKVVMIPMLLIVVILQVILEVMVQTLLEVVVVLETVVFPMVTMVVMVEMERRICLEATVAEEAVVVL
tara:strand:+ start:148 stop:543 length:396 start_codon:yes stop_codon:yes gene_type:complete